MTHWLRLRLAVSALSSLEPKRNLPDGSQGSPAGGQGLISLPVLNGECVVDFKTVLLWRRSGLTRVWLNQDLFQSHDAGN